MKRLLFLGITALLLTGCTKDTIIHTRSAVVNVGEVTAEGVRVKVIGSTEDGEFDLGVYPIADMASSLQVGWTGVPDTVMLERDMNLNLQTLVTYIGTKNKVDKLIDVTTMTCEKGLMFGACMSRIENTQKGLMLLYKEKFSYLK
ncbi:hypothetical protein CNR37_00111 [Pseudomonas phage ventosus]|uniref:Lipoprotein n=1 Tax=Pseudomonas phage ventosus TaxID=2048980 RepID=A0A2H4P829_9CAUD|nr:hypothetical protein CNR37_00111 [Pseudomonas phage ventosus]